MTKNTKARLKQRKINSITNIVKLKKTKDDCVVFGLLNVTDGGTIQRQRTMEAEEIRAGKISLEFARFFFGLTDSHVKSSRQVNIQAWI